MVLPIHKKYIAAYLAKRNPTNDYMIRLANDEVFALSEINAHLESIKAEVIKEKQSIEDHISQSLNPRIEKINALLSAVEEHENESIGNE